MPGSVQPIPSTNDRTTLLQAVLLPGLVAMFGLISLGAPLAVLPVRVDTDLGFGPVVAGVVLAAEGLATLMSRPFVGRHTDRRGARGATVIGLWAAGSSGAFYLVADVLPLPALPALGVMVLGRIAMGIGQGFLFSGGTAWAAILAGPRRQGRAMSWIGLLFFLGISAGTLLGGVAGHLASSLARWFPRGPLPHGFTIAALLTMLAPLGGLILSSFAPPAPSPAHGGPTMPLPLVLKAIWRPALGFGLAAMGYIGTVTFIVLAFLHRGWNNGSLALSAFVGAFALARPLFSGLCDHAEGPSAILLSLGALAGGLLLLGLAPDATLAILGTVIAGSGMSMTYPLLALPVVRAVPASQIGLAIGLFDASYDIAGLITPPLAGLIVATIGYSALFSVLALVSLVAMVPAALAWTRRPSTEP